MDKIIATIVIIVMTLGLISYALIGQLGSIRDTADVITEEENKLEIMLKNRDVVPLSTVKNYISRSEASGYSISVDGKIINDLKQLDTYSDGALFIMNKIYNEYGEVTAVSFTLRKASDTGT